MSELRGRESGGAGRRTLSLAVIGLLALGLRLPFITGLPDDPDGVRLIRSLETFDILDFSPHFPGYPLAVALARGLPGDAGIPWALLSALAGTLAAVVAAEGMRRRLGEPAGWAAGLGVAVLPFAVQMSWRVGTDVAALPLLLGALFGLGREKREFWGGLALGLTLGIRPSWAPWALAIFCGRRVGRCAMGLGVGVAVWLIPTFFALGVETYLGEGWRFTVGHFSAWGGSAFSTDAAARSEAMMLNWGTIPWSLPALGGGPLPWLALVLPGGFLLWRRRIWREPTWRPLLVGAGGYGAWILGAQNPEHARHVLPLVILGTAGCLGALAAEVFPRPGDALPSADAVPSRRVSLARVGVGLVLSLSVGSSLRLGGQYGASSPPALEVAQQLALDPEFDPLLDRIYAGADRPYFTWIGPGWDIGDAASLEALRRDLRSLPATPRRVWVSSGALGKGRPPVVPRLAARRAAELGEWGQEMAVYGLLDLEEGLLDLDEGLSDLDEAAR